MKIDAKWAEKNWPLLLVEEHDFLKWYGSFLDMAEAWDKAWLSWAHFYDKNPKLAEKYKAKADRILELINAQPDWVERYEWL